MEIYVERKLTKHLTPCKFCSKEIQKGDLRVVVRSYGYHQQESLYAHPHCFKLWIEHEVNSALSRDKDFNINLGINPSRRVNDQ
jgi:hypothetical protein